MSPTSPKSGFPKPLVLRLAAALQSWARATVGSATVAARTRSARLDRTHRAAATRRVGLHDGLHLVDLHSLHICDLLALKMKRNVRVHPLLLVREPWKRLTAALLSSTSPLASRRPPPEPQGFFSRCSL